jgi:hypothetical protein
VKDLIDQESAKLLTACVPELREILEVKEGSEITDMGVTSADAVIRLKSIIANMFQSFAIRNKVVLCDP